MRRISSSWTFFYKRVFPAIWFAFLLVFIGISLFANPRTDRSLLFPFIVVPAGMMVFGYIIMKKLVFDLVDEVWDDGHALVVRNGGQEQRVEFADIKNVNYAPLVNPPRVVLSVRRPTVFGDQIAFCAPLRLLPFSSSPVISELIDRIDAARRRSS
jgi:hypothetical protein